MRYYCNICNETITENVFRYSMKHYNKALCINHQSTGNLKHIAIKRVYEKNCNICKETISEQVYNYSTKHIGIALCIRHQKTVTPEAIKLSKALKNLEVTHVLEAYDGHKHIDIAIESAKLYIELDGSQHGFSSKQMLADDDRDKHSLEAGYTTKRIPNGWVNQNVDKLALNIARLATKREYELKEQENKLTVLGIMKTIIKTAQSLSEKLEDFE